MFKEKPTKETSPFAMLVRDKELTAKVDIVLYEWGMQKNPDGSVTNHQLPEEYKFVNYGPYFYLQHATDSTKGFEMKDVQRTPEAMKKWIFEKLASEPSLTANAASAPAKIVPKTVSAQPQVVSAQPREIPPHVQQMLDKRAEVKQQYVPRVVEQEEHQRLAQEASERREVQAAQQREQEEIQAQQHQEVQAQAAQQRGIQQQRIEQMVQSSAETESGKMIMTKSGAPEVKARRFIARNNRSKW
jgi:hypothetical protein